MKRLNLRPSSTRSRGRDRRRRPGLEALEARLVLSGSIEGTIFNDLNLDGVRQAGEAGIPGRTVYIDQNANGLLDSGEISTQTDGLGKYAFAGLDAGTYVVRQVGVSGSTLTTPAVPIDELNTLIPLPSRTDLIFDQKRNQLLIATVDGDIQRYDLETRSLLTPIPVGASLGGGDITPDGKYLYVTDFSRGPKEGTIHKVDLDTEAVTDLNYLLDGGEGGGWDLKIASNGIAFMTSRYEGSGGVPLRLIDLATDTFSRLPYYVHPHSTIMQNTTIRRSLDRSLLFFEEANNSGGPTFTYDARTGTYSPKLATNTYLGQGLHAVNRDGTLMALSLLGSASIVAPNFDTVQVLGRFNGGLVFDPVRELLYIVDEKAGQIVAYDMATRTERYRIDNGEPPDSMYPGAFGNTQLAISQDGNTLFLETPGGVRRFDLDNGGRPVELEDGAVITGKDFGVFSAPPLVPSPIVRVDGQAVSEGNSGFTTATFTVTLSKPSDKLVTLRYDTADGTAIDGIDYQGTTGSLAFAPGETSKTVTVKVIGDTFGEADETFRLVLSDAVNAELSGVAASGTITILNEEDEIIPVVVFTQSEFGITEANSGLSTLSVQVFISPTSSRTVTVGYSTINGSAESGLDFVPVSGELTFAPGEQSKWIHVLIINNTLIEPDKRFQIALSSPVNATVGGDGFTSVVIYNDDLPGQIDDSPGRLAFSAPYYEISEDAERAIVTIVRTDGTAAGATVYLSTEDGTAVQGINYVSTGTTVYFAAGLTSRSVAIPILRDGRNDGDRHLKLFLSNPGGGAGLASTGVALMLIKDSDPRPAAPQMPPPSEVPTPEAPAPAVPPAVVPSPVVRTRAIQLAQKRQRLTSITVDFDGPLDPIAANSLASYRLVRLDRRGREKGMIAINSARYDASNGAVTLTLKRPLAFVGSIRLSAPLLIDSVGRPYEGPGGAFIATMTRARGKLLANMNPTA